MDVANNQIQPYNNSDESDELSCQAERVIDKVMEYTDIFHLLSTDFKNKSIFCALIGGFAVNYYKVTRQTADIDFLADKKDIEKIVDILEPAGYIFEKNHQVFARFAAPANYLMDVDFMFVGSETLSRIIREGKEIYIAGQEFTVPSLDHLIALKLHSLKYNLKIREFKDLPDIINLIIINKIDTKGEQFRGLCMKYGTEELYNRIIDNIREV